MMNYEAIEKLIKLIDASSLKEFEIEENGLRIFMSKNDGKQIKPSKEVVNHQEELKSNFEMVEAKEEICDKVIHQEAALNKNLYTIKSPIVGTYYASPSEDGEPYVKEGDKVQSGSILCIVEAMKLMNEIECEVSGIVSEILVSNGELVEYGQPIMTIEI